MPKKKNNRKKIQLERQHRKKVHKDRKSRLAWALEQTKKVLDNTQCYTYFIKDEDDNLLGMLSMHDGPDENDEIFRSIPGAERFDWYFLPEEYAGCDKDFTIHERLEHLMGPWDSYACALDGLLKSGIKWAKASTPWEGFLPG